MSNGNTTVSLTLQVKGQAASQELKRISDDQVRSTTKIKTSNGLKSKQLKPSLHKQLRLVVRL